MSWSLLSLAFVAFVFGSGYDAALRTVRKVMRSLPFDPEALMWAFWVHLYPDGPAEAFRYLNQSARSAIPTYLQSLNQAACGMALMFKGDFDAAENYLLRSLEIAPDGNATIQLLSSVYVQAGELGKADAMKDRLLALFQDQTLWRMMWRPDQQYPPGIVAFYDGLRAAGLAER